jgi:hypothetical protein
MGFIRATSQLTAGTFFGSRLFCVAITYPCAPLGLFFQAAWFPTACAAGCVLSPLRGSIWAAAALQTTAALAAAGRS